MVEFTLAYETKLTHSGIFDFKEFYRFLYEYITSREYVVIEKGYSEKVKPEGKEISIEWLCLRRISDYFRFRIKVAIRIIDMVSVEVMRDGVKVKRDKGTVEVKFTAYLERDYENRWEANPFLKFLRGIYDKYIIRNTIVSYRDALAAETDEINAQVKAFLALEARR